MQQNWLSGAFLSADLRDVDPVEVNFSNYLQLAGVRMIREAAGITLRLRWRTLRPPARPWRCFAHVLSQDTQISSLDHEILRGRPPITQWQEGDQGYESLRLWLPNPPEDVKLRLGVYDPEINVRCAVLASTLAVLDESSAVSIEPDRAPGNSYVVKFEEPLLTPCGVAFEGGLELAAYSVARHGELVWLRLKWIMRHAPRRRLRFFGHLVTEAAPETPALAQFDQDLAIDGRWPATAVEQNVVRRVAYSGPAWLRAGLFKPSNLKRLKVLNSPVAADERYWCAYLDWPPRGEQG